MHRYSELAQHPLGGAWCRKTDFLDDDIIRQMFMLLFVFLFLRHHLSVELCRKLVTDLLRFWLFIFASKAISYTSKKCHLSQDKLSIYLMLFAQYKHASFNIQGVNMLHKCKIQRCYNYT